MHIVTIISFHGLQYPKRLSFCFCFSASRSSHHSRNAYRGRQSPHDPYGRGMSRSPHDQYGRSRSVEHYGRRSKSPHDPYRGSLSTSDPYEARRYSDERRQSAISATRKLSNEQQNYLSRAEEINRSVLHQLVTNY